MEKFVLVHIPAGNGTQVDRYHALSHSRAKEILQIGNDHESSWFAGASIIRDPKDYPRYGFKDDPRIGAIRDDDAIHLTRARYEEYLARSQKFDELDDDTAGDITSEVEYLKSQLREMQAAMKETDEQKGAKKHISKKERLKDEAMTKKE